MHRPPRKVLVALGIWDLIWKGIAVTVAVRNGQKRWLIPLLAVSSGGILPIVYLARFAARGNDRQG